MKKTISLLAAATALLAVPAIAATKEAFTCEKIKDKVVRESCVESRGAEKTKGSENQKFVIRAKEALTHNFKDPGSAQFANLILVTDDVAKSKTLCGTDNAKNSYVGYVGSKTFYVRWTQAY